MLEPQLDSTWSAEKRYWIRVSYQWKVSFHRKKLDEGRFSYMLITEQIEAALQSGSLVQAKPIAAWEGVPRVVLMCKPIFESLETGRQSIDEAERQCWAKVEAAFSHFIAGGLVTEQLLKQLKDYKNEHWAFRCRNPRPSIRVFGRFAMPDVFVATHAVSRTALRGMWSPEFEHEKLVCEEHWSNAGLGEPFSDPPKFRYSEYISGEATRKLAI